MRKTFYYQTARYAMKDFLSHMYEEACFRKKLKVLLPGYIGVSPKEGSGIYDPIVELSDIVEPIFYKMTPDLFIDVEDAASCISSQKSETFVFLRVNYFGFIDPRSSLIDDLVHAAGGFVLEDNAHAFFTYHLQTAHKCDAAFFSLHKQFPFEKGGMLAITNDSLRGLNLSGYSDPKADEDPWRYDMSAITKACRQNFFVLQELASKAGLPWVPLRSISVNDSIVPQTFPIVLLGSDRYAVYLEMNEQGYGVTSLYHTLIEPLREPRYEDAVRLSGKILNLPVHQDCFGCDYSKLIQALKNACQRHE